MSSEQQDAARPFGPYRLRRVLGEGAMGRVWLAFEPAAEREVALKLLRAPAVRSDFAERFQREIRLLGALEHPNIARLYAAGSVDGANGAVPYLAMEYVRGAQLLSHGATLALKPRMALIATIARTIHHAHTRGVIHRDLKPDNILIDEHGAPRILDFGIAHVTDEDAADAMTRAGEVLGTLAYMSPEQLRGGSNDADPRMDVYALGVIAYELIAGERPHAGPGEGSLSAAILRVTREPPRPVGRLVPAARGDLETIVMYALATDPSQRYASAADFATDIERWLSQQPIAARPPSASYVMALFVRRHKALAAGFLIAAAALLTATAASTYFALSEASARAQAEARLAEREAVSGFLLEMLTAADPENTLGERISVLDVLDIARAKLDTPDEVPAAVALQLHRTLGTTYAALGRGDLALSQMQHALDLAQSAAAAPELRQQLALDFAIALAAAGRDGDSLVHIEALLAELESGGPMRHQLLVDARVHQAWLLDERGEIAAAEAILHALLNPTPGEPALTPEERMHVQSRLALSLHKRGHYDAAIMLAEQAAEAIEARYGPLHPRTITALEVIAVSLRDMARYPEAEAIYRRTLATREAVLGPEHPLTQQTRGGLAGVLAFADQADEAWSLVRRSYSALSAQLGIEAEAVRILGNLYAHVAAMRGDHAEAIRMLRQLVALNDARPGGPTATDLPDYNNLAYNLTQLGRCEEALQVQDSFLPLAQQLLGAEHTHTALFRYNQALCLQETGQPQAAVAVLQSILPTLLANLGADHPRTLKAQDRLAGLQAAR